MYTEEKVVGIAKRENNKKRTYLVVNRLQGKHVPVRPSQALHMFGELAKLVEQTYKGERLLLVGFAETATAIGAAVASNLSCHYIQTTREKVEGVHYLFFTESHSHATEQKLVKEDIEMILPNIDRIVFVEDEVTTGNTIRKIIDIIEERYEYPVKFAVASLLNGMSKEDEDKYHNKEIGMLYLIKTNHSLYEAKAAKFAGDGTYYQPILEAAEYNETSGLNVPYKNARRLVESKKYKDACVSLAENIKEKLAICKEENVLVLGTEEFMYPALIVAEKIEEMGCEVRFHATTRSPIVVSNEDEYPLHSRFELKSLYDEERVTFIYDLKKYDRVIVVTDAEGKEDTGIQSLINALKAVGNDKINVIRWC